MVDSQEGEDFQASLRQFILEALEAKASGVPHQEYANLLQEIQFYRKYALSEDNEEHSFALSHIVENLTGCVSAIDERSHESLLSELFTISLWECTEALRNALLGFMLHLVVANVLVLQQTLQVLVLNMGLPPGQMHKQPGTPGREWVPAAEAVAVQDGIIHTLEKIMQHAPVAASLLTPVLARGVPNRVLPRDAQCTYLRGLLRIAESARAAAIRDTLLAVVVQHLVGLDVEIRWQDITLSPEPEDDNDDDDGVALEAEADIFELEGQTGSLQLDPSKFGGEDAPPERWQGAVTLERVQGRGGFEGQATDAQPSTSRRTEADEAADKLDSMMTLTFQHLSHRTRKGQIQRVRQALLDSFFSTILSTHRSKFTQYLLWYLLDQDPEHSSKLFLKRLLVTLADVRQPDITRSAAAAYLASFLARAAFLPEHVLLGAVEQLARWCLGYCVGVESRPAAPATPRARGAEAQQGLVHQVFYAACQGLLYVLCYRLEQLMAPKADAEKASAAALQELFRDIIPTLLKSRLDPMAVCLPTVVAEFTLLAARLGLLDCRALLPGRDQAVRTQRPLEMLFPFDPYLLRRSAAFLDLRRTFVRWKQGHSQAAGEEAEGKAEDVDASSSSDSGSDTSGLETESGSDESETEAESVHSPPQPAASRNGVTIARSHSAGKRQRGSQGAPDASGSSAEAAGGDALSPMSWTPNARAPERWRQTIRGGLRPLDVRE